ncbi:MAG: prepilin-type N-terminal cleavage/methylation domain-containing protein [Akkermansiaceae bacterium]|nr:prepilin-type N-terminal cleavage/methylation domain-containing protein [Akkermansiaceae bacterium]
MKSNSKGASRKGFTIIELMVAMTITAIIVGVLVTITGSAVDTWTRSRNELRAARQAEAMINVLSKDLESLVVRSDRPQEWLSAILTPPEGDEGRSTNAARLVFFTAATDRYEGQIGINNVDMGGDISCVGYQLDWKDPVSVGSQQFETFVLNRHLANPDITFENLLGQTDKTDPARSLDSLFVNGNPTTAFGGFDDDMDQDRNFVCENVFQFTMVFHVDIMEVDGSVQTQLVSVSPGNDGMEVFRVHHDSIQAQDTIGAVPDAALATGVLTAVEVSLTVLTDSAIVQLRENPELSESPDWLKKNSYHFSRLVQVPRK